MLFTCQPFQASSRRRDLRMLRSADPIELRFGLASRVV
jgi:hypothetical protein